MFNGHQLYGDLLLMTANFLINRYVLESVHNFCYATADLIEMPKIPVTKKILNLVQEDTHTHTNTDAHRHMQRRTHTHIHPNTDTHIIFCILI